MNIPSSIIKKIFPRLYRYAFARKNPGHCRRYGALFGFGCALLCDATRSRKSALREKLAALSMDDLTALLYKLKAAAGSKVHNSTDTLNRTRLVRAVEIETYNAEQTALRQVPQPEPQRTIHPFIVGTTFPRDMLRSRIRKRLKSRLENGMIEETEALHRCAPGLSEGASWERLERLGLEYRFVSQYLRGLITSREELETKLGIAIGQFAKRQETWFRGMEKKGVRIHWLEHDGSEKDCSVERRFEQIVRLLQTDSVGAL